MTTDPNPSDHPLEEAATLIELYFATESAAERDMVFEQLVANPAPIVDTFLHAMLEEDDDEHMRLAAACELAIRGKEPGVRFLHAQLQEPISLGFFMRAIDVLCDVQGKAMYEPLRAIWLDTVRDMDERRQAMLALEDTDTPRALNDYAEFVRHFADDLQHIHEDQLQAAALAFARHHVKDGVALFQNLKTPIERSTALQNEEKILLVALIDEAIRWLQA